MTNKEAITLVKDAFSIWESEYDTGNDWSEEHEACDMAIKALEQTDKIEDSNFSTEQYEADLRGAYDCGYNCGYADAMNDIGGGV